MAITLTGARSWVASRSSRVLRNSTLTVGATLFAIFVLVALLGPVLYPVDPLALETANRMLAPGSAGYPLGTDGFGRDELSRLLHGARTSLVIGAAVTLITAIVGGLIGLLAAFNAWFEAISMRLLEGVMAFPAILLAIAVSAAFGASPLTVIVSLSIVYVPFVARIVRSAAMRVKELPFVEAQRVLGASRARIIFRCVLPNVLSPLMVQATFIFADALLVEAALSFIGAGVPAPEPSWGNMLEQGRDSIYTAWWLVVLPGAAIMITILSINLLGDGLRDHFDPYQQFIRRPRLRRLTRR